MQRPGSAVKGGSRLSVGTLRAVLCGVTLLGSLGLLRGQEEAPLEVGYSYDRLAPPEPLGPSKGGFTLRPNTTQPVYLHVTNSGQRARQLLARLLVERKKRLLEFATAEVQVKGEDTVVISDWKLSKTFAVAPAASPPAAPSPGAPPPVPPVAAPPAVELEGPGLEVRLQLQDLAPNAARAPLLDLKVPVDVLTPSEYVEVIDPRYQEDSKLTVRVRSRGERFFRGIPVPVQLLPGRGLAGTPLKGVLQQTIDAPDQAVLLLADNLRDSRFQITVDGYQRGFIYSLDTIGTHPQRMPQEELRVRTTEFLPSGESLRLLIETDNVTRKDAVIDVTLFRDEQKIRELTPLKGPRQETVRLLAPEPDGALPFQAQVRDWNLNLDTRGIVGKFAVEATLTYPGRGAVLTTTPKRIPLILDATPPEGARFRSPLLLQKVIRGKPVQILAEAIETDSGIADVSFFVGKPTADHKAPPNATLVPGIRAASLKEPVWTPGAPVLTSDLKGRTDLGVIFISRAGLRSSATVEIDLVDPEPPPPPGKPKLASIVVSLTEGGRPQDGLTVELFDGKGIMIQKGVSGPLKNKDGVAEPGKILFKDLPPGTYRAAAVKIPSNTRGDVVVSVLEGEEKAATILLFR